jgi:hypothetical protein
MGDDEDVRRVKQRLLHEVDELTRQLRQHGYMFPPRAMTLHDSIEEIQFEIDHGRSVLEMRSTVDAAKEYVPLGYQILESMNNRFGPFVPINGFTDELLKKMHENPQRYTYVLERMYRRYWRKGSVSPLAEFFMVFVAPMLVYAVKQKFVGADTTSKHRQPKTASMAPEPERSYYEPEPIPMMTPLPNNHIGPIVQPQPNPSTNFFPPPMMQQPSVATLKHTPVVPNLNHQQVHQQHPPSSGRRRALKPPSRGVSSASFPATQSPLAPVLPLPAPTIPQPVSPSQHQHPPAHLSAHSQEQSLNPPPPRLPAQLHSPPPPPPQQHRDAVDMTVLLDKFHSGEHEHLSPVEISELERYFEEREASKEENLADANVQGEAKANVDVEEVNRASPPLQRPIPANVLNITVPPTPDKNTTVTHPPSEHRLPPIAEDPLEDEEDDDYQPHVKFAFDRPLEELGEADLDE